MALSAAANTFNAAVDTLIAAWETYTDTLAANAEIQIVKMNRRLDIDHSQLTGLDRKGVDAQLGAEDWDFGRKFKASNTPDTAQTFYASIGGSGPLFFKLTNDANDLTS